jgi:hypothetical protein
LWSQSTLSRTWPLISLDNSVDLCELKFVHYNE